MTEDGNETEGEGARQTLLDRLLPPVDPLGDDGHPKPSRMSQHEQMVTVALGFANVAIAAGTATTMERNQGLALLAGVAASVLAVIGARMGNRMVGALGLMACVSTRSSSTVMFVAFGLPFYAAALWIFLRFNRLSKEQNIRRRKERLAARASSGTSRTPGPRAAKGTTKGPTRPAPSKRYTPPKAPKKRPPPPPKPPKDRSIVD